jgi:hypothetical protein
MFIILDVLGYPNITLKRFKGLLVMKNKIDFGKIYNTSIIEKKRVLGYSKEYPDTYQKQFHLAKSVTKLIIHRRFVQAYAIVGYPGTGGINI